MNLSCDLRRFCENTEPITCHVLAYVRGFSEYQRRKPTIVDIVY